jgi:hypothetical protein
MIFKCGEDRAIHRAAHAEIVGVQDQKLGIGRQSTELGNVFYQHGLYGNCGIEITNRVRLQDRRSMSRPVVVVILASQSANFFLLTDDLS